MTDASKNVDGPTKGNWVKFPGIAQCEMQKAIPGVIASPEMEFDILYNNWRSMTLNAGSLMEAEGVMAVENNRPLFIADQIRVYEGVTTIVLTMTITSNAASLCETRVYTSRARFPPCQSPRASTGFSPFICRHISERRTENPSTLCSICIVFFRG